jgi:hypothetical protein
MLSVILIIEAFDNLAKSPFFYYENIFLEIMPFASFQLGG